MKAKLPGRQALMTHTPVRSMSSGSEDEKTEGTASRSIGDKTGGLRPRTKPCVTIRRALGDGANFTECYNCRGRRTGCRNEDLLQAILKAKQRDADDGTIPREAPPRERSSRLVARQERPIRDESPTSRPPSLVAGTICQTK